MCNQENLFYKSNLLEKGRRGAGEGEREGGETEQELTSKTVPDSSAEREPQPGAPLGPPMQVAGTQTPEPPLGLLGATQAGSLTARWVQACRHWPSGLSTEGPTSCSQECSESTGLSPNPPGFRPWFHLQVRKPDVRTTSSMPKDTQGPGSDPKKRQQPPLPSWLTSHSTDLRPPVGGQRGLQGRRLRLHFLVAVPLY